MNVSSSVVVGFGAGILLLFSLLIANVVSFYFCHSKDINNKLFGRRENFGFIFSTMVLYANWAIYCLSESRAERAGVREVFSNLKPSARRQLIFHFFGMWASLFLLILGWLLLV